MSPLAALALGLAAAAGGVAAGRAHQRGCPWGTRYWKAQATLALALHDEARLLEIEAHMPDPHPLLGRVVDGVLGFTVRLAEPRAPRT